MTKAGMGMPALALVMAAGPVVAQQRAQDNAVTSAEDAFGTSIGIQNVGLYSQNDARGFNPQQAGNLRIEGLYYDQQTFLTSPCIVRETVMRIGIAAQTYSFPSPTGIADFRLRTPGDTAAFSGLVSRGPFNGLTVQLEQQAPLGPTLGIDVCAAQFKNVVVDNMRRDATETVGVTLRWRPVDRTEVVPFAAYMIGGGHQELPSVYTDGTVPLPSFREPQLDSQTWTSQAWRMLTAAAVLKSDLGDRWALHAGVFHSREHDPWQFSPYSQLNANGTADAQVDVTPPLQADSTSGEVLLTDGQTVGNRRQQLELMIRGRDVSRRYGGDDDLDFGNLPLTAQTQFAEPAITLTTPNLDLTRQFDVGATVEERWPTVGSAAIGLLKDNYRRTNDSPGGAAATYRTTPWLIDARAAVEGGGGWVYYGSYVQGLEDSALAPISAVNRGEPPAAARTWQIDGGLRYAPGERLRLIVGLFDIHKPYLNLDLANVYRPLGRLRNEGVESSLSYADSGLTLLGGAVLLRPHVALSSPQPGVTGPVPIGPVPLTLNANVDYAPARWGPWAASLSWNRLSSRVATTDDQRYLGPLATVAAGVRFQWTRGEHSWTLRADGFNLADARGLHVSALYLVLPEQGRRYSLTLATDL